MKIGQQDSSFLSSFFEKSESQLEENGIRQFLSNDLLCRRTIAAKNRNVVNNAAQLHRKIFKILECKMKKQFLLLIGISLFFFGNALASEVSFTGKVYMINPRSSSYGQAAYFSDYSAVTVPWGVETRNHPTDGAKQVVGVWIVAPGITVDNPQKAILATLLQAKASGSWVRIYHDSSTGVITQVEVY